MPLKISYFHYLFGNDTALNHVRQFTQAARELGHRVEVGALNLANEQLAEGSASMARAHPSAKRRSRVHRFLSRYLHEPKELLWNLRYRKLERRLLSEQRPDVLIVRDSLLGVSYLPVARRLNIPLVLEINAPACELGMYHDQYLHLPSFIPDRLERYRLRHADRVAAVSTALRDYLLTRVAAGDAAAPPQAEQIGVVPNGVDTDLFDPARWRQPPSELLPAGFEGHPIVGFVGSFQAFHGPELLAAMTLAVSERCPEARFVFAGDGPGLARVQTAVAQLGHRVHFTGRVAHSEIPALSAHIDIGVLPDTAFYCSPPKVLEWMASEVAIVAPSHPCIGELLDGDREALLFPPHDVNALVEAVLRLLREPGRRSKLGAAARARAVAELTWKHNAEKVLMLCRQAIENNRRQG